MKIILLLALISFNALANVPLDDCGMTREERVETGFVCVDISGERPIESWINFEGQVEYLPVSQKTAEEFLEDYELVE